MKGLVLFLVIVLAIASFSLIAASITGDKPEIKKSEILEFSSYTSAVCESKEKFTYCKDEIFVNCNGKISKATDVIECNGIRMDAPKSTGFAVFGNEWKDPRN